MVYKNILSLIGNTPIVELSKLNPNPRVTILAKLEMFNPGGSIKDRVALAMIEGAEKAGLLDRGKIIIEATSGNTGIGLSMVAAVKGYRIVLAMPESVSLERRRILRAYGADLLLTPAHLGTDGAIEKAYQLARENPDKYYLTDQFNNPFNWQAHYYGTAPEIWEQTGGKVDMVVAGLGTTGTAMGISRRLKEYNPKIKMVGVEPYPQERIQGLKNLKESYVPGIYDKNLLDEKINVRLEDAIKTARKLAKEEGILVGMSSGAAMYAAIQKAKELKSGIIVVIFPDGGERYLSTSLFVEKPALTIRLYNTLSRKKEFLQPLKPGEISLYSCGPTVHDVPHLGVWRRLIVSDLLKRYLEFKGLKVKHVINITDIDDKTIAKAIKENKPLKEITQFYTQVFLKTVEILGIKPADYYPLASEHVPEMLKIAERLLQKGYVYEKHHSIYFDITRFKEYGKLSHINLEKIKVGLTVDLDSYEKENPRDFTLLKRCTLQELKAGIYYDTHWGKVRPGWHIECVAMAMKYLGEIIDIHTSGKDLIFPHNENEVAIAEAFTGKIFSRYWIHSELVFVDGKKMSRSSGNYVTIENLLAKGYSPQEIRYFFIVTHYRKPLQFSFNALNAARLGLQKLQSFIFALLALPPGPSYKGLDKEITTLEQGFTKAMDNDLNVSSAMAALFDFVRKMDPVVKNKGISEMDKENILKTLKKINEVLNIFVFELPEIDSKIKSLIDERNKARTNRDWEKADRIRKEIAQKGLVLIDTPRGTFWCKKGA